MNDEQRIPSGTAGQSPPILSTGPRVSPIRFHPIEFLEWFALFAFVCAPLPLVILHLLQLDTKPHYDCAPVVALVAGGLLFLRWREASPMARQIRGAGILSWSALLLALACSAGALLATSPWLGTIAWLCGLASVLLRTEIRWKGPWSLFWLTLPLPLGLDDKLIQRLQLKASQWSSHILDLLGLTHSLEGNIVRLHDKDLFVDEACSGIMSLIAVLSTMAILTVLNRRPALHALPAVLLSGFWAVVMNVARIVLCAYAWSTWKVDLLTGTPHEILGFGTFAGAVILALSTEQLVLFLLGPVSLPEVSSWVQVAAFNPLVRGWNWLGGEPFLDETEEVPQRIPRVSTLGSICRAGFGMACMFCLISPLPAVLAVEKMRQVSLNPAILNLQEDFLPEQIGPWRRMGFKVERRAKADVFGEHSRSWQYTWRDLTLNVSVDFPFSGWHDLRGCYTGIGWTHVDTDLPAIAWAGSEMKHPTGRRGYLLFNMLDPSGQCLEPQSFDPASLIQPRSLAEKAWQRLSQPTRASTQQVTTCQVQVLASWLRLADESDSHSQLTSSEIQSIQDLFRSVQDKVESVLTSQPLPQQAARPAGGVQ